MSKTFGVKESKALEELLRTHNIPDPQMFMRVLYFRRRRDRMGFVRVSPMLSDGKSCVLIVDLSQPEEMILSMLDQTFPILFEHIASGLTAGPIHPSVRKKARRYKQEWMRQYSRDE